MPVGLSVLVGFKTLLPLQDFELKHRRFVLPLGLGSIMSASEAHSRHRAAVQSLKILICNNFGNPICNLIYETKCSIILLRCKISLHVGITLVEQGHAG